MRIVSWNVNGLRAVVRNGYWEDVWRLNPDILCLQEIKAEADQLPEQVRSVDGYTSVFNPARSRKGYSGVALYSKTAPEHIEYSIGGEARFDEEGRVIVAHYSDVILANVYFPNGGQGPERLAYKMDFYDAFLAYSESLRQRTGKPLMVCGDVNTAHEAIDLARPQQNENVTGFLPEERAWIDEMVARGYADTFRHFYPNAAGAYTYWDLKSRARDRNVGWRIDYVFVSADLLPRVSAAAIHADVYGSDHCPISADISAAA